MLLMILTYMNFLPASLMENIIERILEFKNSNLISSQLKTKFYSNRTEKFSFKVSVEDIKKMHHQIQSN